MNASPLFCGFCIVFALFGQLSGVAQTASSTSKQASPSPYEIAEKKLANISDGLATLEAVGGEAKNPEENLTRVSAYLNLTPKQKTAARPILACEFRLIYETRKNPNLSVAAKQARIEAIHQQTETDLSRIISSAQQKTLAILSPQFQTSFQVTPNQQNKVQVIVNEEVGQVFAIQKKMMDGEISVAEMSSQLLNLQAESERQIEATWTPEQRAFFQIATDSIIERELTRQPPPAPKPAKVEPTPESKNDQSHPIQAPISPSPALK